MEEKFLLYISSSCLIPPAQLEADTQKQGPLTPGPEGGHAFTAFIPFRSGAPALSAPESGLCNWVLVGMASWGFCVLICL